MRRRHFLSAATACLVGPRLFADDAAAQSPAQPFDLETVDTQATDAARALASGRDITLTILMPEGSPANVLPATEAFRAATGIGFAFLETPVDDINTRMIINALAGESEFDLALPATFGIPDLAEAGTLAELDAYAAKYQPHDFGDQALYKLGDTYNGHLYGYQTDGDAYVMFYNKALLDDPDEQARFADAHGYPLGIPHTWAELDAMMAHFHRPDEGRYGGALFRSIFYIVWEFWIRMHAKGCWPFDADMEPKLLDPAAVAAAEELVAASQYLHPDVRTDGLFENWVAYAEGNTFCNIGWGGTQKYLNGPQSAIRGKLAFGPTPGGIVDGTMLSVPYFNWGWNYTVSKGSRFPEIAYLFALFACSPRISTAAVRPADGFFDPFRAEHYEDAEIVSAYTESFLETHKASMLGSIPDLYLSGQGEYFDALRENLILADTGQVSAYEAMDRTAKQWSQTTRRLGRANQIAQWKKLRDRYPAEISALLR